MKTFNGIFFNHIYLFLYPFLNNYFTPVDRHNMFYKKITIKKNIRKCSVFFQIESRIYKLQYQHGCVVSYSDMYRTFWTRIASKTKTNRMLAACSCRGRQNMLLEFLLKVFRPFCKLQSRAVSIITWYLWRQWLLYCKGSNTARSLGEIDWRVSGNVTLINCDSQQFLHTIFLSHDSFAGQVRIRLQTRSIETTFR